MLRLLRSLSLLSLLGLLSSLCSLGSLSLLGQLSYTSSTAAQIYCHYPQAQRSSNLKPLARIAYGSESEALYRMVRSVALLKQSDTISEFFAALTYQITST